MNELTLAALGLASEVHSKLPAEQACLLAATLDVEAPQQGDAMPFLWHWAFFNTFTPTADLGPDGHPERVHPLMVRFPRRMWVGGEVRLLRTLFLDLPSIRRTRVVNAEIKTGSTGDLLLVTLEHVIEQEGAEAVLERQDVIFRAGGGVTAAPGPRLVYGDAKEFSLIFTPTEALLFRFSAATFNSHRIHYDSEYAVGVELYPGLVVHAPLTAMLIARSVALCVGRPLKRFAYRASVPLFAGEKVHVRLALEDGDNPGATVTALRSDGAIAMTASGV